MQPTIRRCIGAAVLPYLAELARLRIAIFRDFPYLYDGTLEFESVYLQRYAESAQSLIVLALVGDRVVGASTGIPLADESAPFVRPFVTAGYDPARIFYGGESVVLPAYRGRGTYRQFFAERERYARELGRFTTFAFCSVERAADHRLRPRNYAGLDPLWSRYGYAKHPELVAKYIWKDVDEAAESPKPLVFWLKSLVAATGDDR